MDFQWIWLISSRFASCHRLDMAETCRDMQQPGDDGCKKGETPGLRTGVQRLSVAF